MASSQPFSTTAAVKRIPLEVGELQYLASTATTTTSSLKGCCSHLFSPSCFFYTHLWSLAGPSSRFRTKQTQHSQQAVQERAPTSPISPSSPLASTSLPIMTSSQEHSETMSDTSDHEHQTQAQTSGKRKRKV
jgi:hypothetical protein